MRGSTPALSIAPMMDRTDRHFRQLMRLISQHTLLYTEMITTGALTRGDAERHLRFAPNEHPVSLQLGGDEPAAMAASAVMGEEAGYDEVNLNIGCPSDRVQSGNFGVCLMGQPERVAECVRAMREAVSIPVTVKHRIGFDEQDSFESMLNFVDVVAAAGADRFTVHARKAWLKGLSPKENRTVPPLRYADVHRLKQERPALSVEINGGVRTLAEAEEQLEHVDAVMIGRAAYDRPWMFADADARIFGATGNTTQRAVVEAMAHYAEGELSQDGRSRLGHIARHMLNLFAGEVGARQWRRTLTETSFKGDAGPQVLLDALKRVEDAQASRAARATAR